MVKSAQTTSAKPKIKLPSREFGFVSLRCDNGSCGHLRSMLVEDQITSSHPNCLFTASRHLFSDENIFCTISAITVQRNIPSINWMADVLFPMRAKYHFKVIYDIDDLLLYDLIPEFNIYRNRWKGQETNIKSMMTICDAVTVSTPRLRDSFVKHLGLPEEKFHVLPNYYPRYVTDTFAPAQVKARIASQKKRRPRIVFSASMAHFNYRDEGPDDFSMIADWIIENRKRYQFIFLGTAGARFKPYAKDFIIEPEIPFIFHFPRLRRFDPDLIVQPLLNCELNCCKSDIRFQEGWGMGIPVLCANTANYMDRAPEYCFGSAEELDRKVNALFADGDGQFEQIRRDHQRMDDEQAYLDHHGDDWLRVLLPEFAD